jgi:hypothetical protein
MVETDLERQHISLLGEAVRRARVVLAGLFVRLGE